MCEWQLDSHEARVLGVLIEKCFSTPESYPLTLNSITLACNQKSSRNPTMSLSEEEVSATLDLLRSRRLVEHVITSNLGSSKFGYDLKGIAEFTTPELAILCVMLLRGPQTLGQIRSRTERIYYFTDLAGVRANIEKLTNHEKGPFVIRLEREPGHKEARYTHLFSAQSEPAGEEVETRAIPGDGISRIEERLDLVEEDIRWIKQQLTTVLTHGGPERGGA